jgi:hypothetical protein
MRLAHAEQIEIGAVEDHDAVHGVVLLGEAFSRVAPGWELCRKRPDPLRAA